MGPLAGVLALLAGTVASGPVLVAAFSMGLYGWPAVATALTVGLVGAGALARPLEAEIKRRDPHWDARRDRPHPGPDRQKPPRSPRP